MTPALSLATQGPLCDPVSASQYRVPSHDFEGSLIYWECQSLSPLKWGVNILVAVGDKEGLPE